MASRRKQTARLTSLHRALALPRRCLADCFSPDERGAVPAGSQRRGISVAAPQSPSSSDLSSGRGSFMDALSADSSGMFYSPLIGWDADAAHLAPNLSLAV